MDYPLTSFANGHYQVELLVMPRGEHTLEVIEAKQSIGFVLLRGRLRVKAQGRNTPALVATPRAPVFLVNSGQYHVVAESSCFGFRGVHMP